MQSKSEEDSSQSRIAKYASFVASHGRRATELLSVHPAHKVVAIMEEEGYWGLNSNHFGMDDLRILLEQIDLSTINEAE